MDSKASLSMDKAQNEILSAQALKKLSEDDALKKYLICLLKLPFIVEL